MEKVGKFIDKKSFLFKLLTDIETHHKNNTHYNIPNLLFYGTAIDNIYSIIRIICNIFSNNDDYFTKIVDNKYLNVLLVDCIINSSIIDIRNNVQQFIKSKFIKYQGHKIIIFNNIDDLTDEAQCALRVLMEENNTNLFLGVATNTNNIVSPILSRMMTVFVDDKSIKIVANKSKRVTSNGGIYNKMKYDKTLHWLYSTNKSNIEHTIKYFDKIKNELVKIQNIHTINRLFCDLETNIYDSYQRQLNKHDYVAPISNTNKNNNLKNYINDLETHVITRLVKYICLMKKYEY